MLRRRQRTAATIFNAIADDFAVAKGDDALGMGRDFFVVGNQQNGATFLMQVAEQRHDFLAALAVERPGRLIGQNHRRIVHQGPGDGDPLLLTAG